MDARQAGRIPPLLCPLLMGKTGTADGADLVLLRGNWSEQKRSGDDLVTSP